MIIKKLIQVKVSLSSAKVLCLKPDTKNSQTAVIFIFSSSWWQDILDDTESEQKMPQTQTV